MALRTRTSPYDLARLLDEYPEVFDAYFEQIEGASRKGRDFGARREASRAERIRKAVGRR